MAWFEISNDIERRFYQEALSPDLKWRKQGLASLGRCCLIENAISPPNCEVFKQASKCGYPNIWCVDIFKKIWESSSSFLSWLRFMKVGKVEKNFHTFLLSSSLIHHLIGPWKWGFEGFRPWAASKNRLKHLIPILYLYSIVEGLGKTTGNVRITKSSRGIPVLPHFWNFSYVQKGATNLYCVRFSKRNSWHEIKTVHCPVNVIFRWKWSPCVFFHFLLIDLKRCCKIFISQGPATNSSRTRQDTTGQVRSDQLRSGSGQVGSV